MSILKKVSNLFDSPKKLEYSELTKKAAPAQIMRAESKSTNEIVEEIHNMFNTASDKAVEDANIILQNTVIDKDAEVLEKLGFTGTKKVVENKEGMQKRKLAEDEAKVVMYYQQTHPAYKFILNRQVSEICNKYNLVLGDVSRYKGEVPAKNIAEISKFDAEKISKEDTRYVTIFYSMRGMVEEEAAYSQFIEFHKQCNEHHMHYTIAPKTTFSICAPISDMDTSGMRLENHMLVEVPDPVVLYPVRGGWLIISAWGEEATDENVVNQKMN